MCDPYSDKKTGVLKNKLGISDREKLIAIERALSIEAIVDLRKKKISTISFDAMKKIHKKIFGKIYFWAGVPRTVDISKGGTVFCRAIFIESAAQDIFSRLKKKNFLKGLDRDVFVQKLQISSATSTCFIPFAKAMAGHRERSFFI